MDVLLRSGRYFSAEERAILEDIRQKAREIESGALRLKEIRAATMRMSSRDVEAHGA